jgi:hypothetical protein
MSVSPPQKWEFTNYPEEKESLIARLNGGPIRRKYTRKKPFVSRLKLN